MTDKPRSVQASSLVPWQRVHTIGNGNGGMHFQKHNWPSGLDYLCGPCEHVQLGTLDIYLDDVGKRQLEIVGDVNCCNAITCQIESTLHSTNLMSEV